MKNEVKTQLESFAASNEVSSATRKVIWGQLNPGAKFDKNAEFCASVSAALVKVGAVAAADEKATTGALLALGIGNQSALRQMFAKQDKLISGLAL